MRDVWLIFQRELIHCLRQPVWVVMGLAQPVLYMFFFGPLVGKFVARTHEFPPGDPWTIFAPALMVQMVIIGSTFVGMSLLAEYKAGIFDRFRVTPASPVSLLFGKVLTAAVTVLIQSTLILAVCCVSFGLRPSIPGVILCYLIVGLLAVSLASCSYSFALRVKNEEALSGSLNALLLPTFLLSGTLLPITAELAPRWLWIASRLNPVAYVMDASRASFRGDVASDAVISGLVALALITTASISWGVATFSRVDG
ncbi:ABC-2 type transport system permease protein [Streptomyces sp. B3I7]|uniref:ABC transporter permease n=1 Tax=Streptomyces sp. B3I7 TaxID=3042269 RepID=UPI002785E6AF|nr:ABC transporter permease [Streptomyces sp. B3I7]MDQ0808368.1 ABC-2 type transport system permease protein [Streptomyces sp. B3I7]